MNCYRITKYNPIYRNAEGAYLKDEWTEYSDVGKSYNGILFTEKEYLKTENYYIDVIITIIKQCNVSYLKILSLEIIDPKIEREFTLRNNKKITIEHIDILLQYCLRNRIWCKFVFSKKLYIHFGYDYYMYIGCDLPFEKINEICRRNYLYCENYVSPYSN